MSKFNKTGTVRVGPKSAVVASKDTYGAVNYAGGIGYTRDAKGELFTLALTFMGGDSNFYEKGDERFTRLMTLISDSDVHEDLNWSFNFVRWLRRDVGLRTVSMVVAVEIARQRVAAQLTDPVDITVTLNGGNDVETLEDIGNKHLIDSALDRADEPAEMLAYWNAMYGEEKSTFPKYMKAGISLAVRRLYNEFSYLKYGKAQGKIGFIDVLRAVHPEPKDAEQKNLFAMITGSQVGGLDMIATNTWLHSLPTDFKKSYIGTAFGPDRSTNPTEAFKNGGFTWENVSEWSPEGMTGRVWDLIIPNMGLTALIRNLRNFDEAEGGISGLSVLHVVNRLTEREAIRKSRLMPYQIYQAYRSVESVRWSVALEAALGYSLENIPLLKGRSLILVDMSGSMFGSQVSDKSVIKYSEVASLFGAGWKLADPKGVDLYQYGSEYDGLVRAGYTIPVAWGGGGRGTGGFEQFDRWDGVTRQIKLNQGGSILRAMGKFHNMGGTQTIKAVQETIRPDHDRVILITDEQNFYTVDSMPIPNGKSLYVWNLGGYKVSGSNYGRYNRHSFGGLTDHAFKQIPLLEAGRNTGWPWESVN